MLASANMNKRLFITTDYLRMFNTKSVCAMTEGLLPCTKLEMLRQVLHDKEKGIKRIIPKR
jgi:hypothetical protein